MGGSGSTGGRWGDKTRFVGSLLQPLGDRNLPGITARKIKFPEFTSSGYWIPFFFFCPQKLIPTSTQSKQPGWRCDLSEELSVSLLMHSLTLGNQRSLFWKCESNISFAWRFCHHSPPAPMLLSAQRIFQLHPTTVTAHSRLGWVHSLTAR